MVKIRQPPTEWLYRAPRRITANLCALSLKSYISRLDFAQNPQSSQPRSFSTTDHRFKTILLDNATSQEHSSGRRDAYLDPFFKAPRTLKGQGVSNRQEEGVIEIEDAVEDALEAYEATELDLEHITDSVGAHNKADTKAPQGYIRRGLHHVSKNLFSVKENPKKVDLSYTNVLDWEENLDKTYTTPATTSFRSDSRTRSVLVAYMRDIQPLMDEPVVQRTSQWQARLSDSLRLIFHDVAVDQLAEARFDVSDVACWSWILSASSVNIAVTRYVALHKEFLDSGSERRISRLVLLQILRAGHISSLALKQLCDTLRAELLICEQNRIYRGFSWVTRVCIVVRLLRHARQVSPERYSDIEYIVGHLFSNYYKVQEGDTGMPEMRRLSHIFNRFLSLLSLPPARNAFNSYLLQQNAQLSLVRMMLSFKPSLPVTREGFRALIKVQLLHKKTHEERAWAGAKSLSWPPWREDKLGIEEDLDYPGQESRAARLLRRMAEAGYTRGSWEQAASILGGWDIDKSPTVQTRAVLPRSRLPWLLSPIKPKPGADTPPDHDLWNARIEATRTKLEAWAAFCAYMKDSKPGTRRFKPFYAMLGKLMTRTIPIDSRVNRKHFPGDLLETFEDPRSPNQMVFVERKIPTMEEFYEEMLREGIRPAGGMLCDLLDYAPSLEVGFRYIQDATWNEVTVDMLLHAEKYPRDTVKHKVMELRPQFVSSFIRLLCRFALTAQPVVRLPSSAIGDTEYKLHRTRRGQLKFCYPITYAEELLRISEMKDIAVWNGYLQGINDLITVTNLNVEQENLLQSEGFDIKLNVLRHFRRTFNFAALQNSSIRPDIDTFRLGANLAELTLGSETYSRKLLSVVRLSKMLFAYAICGHDFTQLDKHPPLFVPEVRDLKQLVRGLLSAHDIPDLMALLRWLNDNSEMFKTGSQTNPHVLNPDGLDASEQYLSNLHEILCAIRLFLEGSDGAPPTDPDALWFTTPLRITKDQIETARQLCEPLGWPTDEQVNQFLEKPRNQRWMVKVAKAADLTQTNEYAPYIEDKTAFNPDKDIRYQPIGDKQQEKSR